MMAARDRDTVRELRSFGRKRGRKPSAAQHALLDTVLPRVAIDLNVPSPRQPAELFSPCVRDVWLEIGFGGGEHLLWQAARNPDVGVIGCEPFQDGVVKVLAAIQELQIGNVRLHAGDAREVLRWLPEGALGRVYILFPDPWPKKRHRKRRLFNAALLDQLSRTLRPGGELHAATDIADYAEQMTQLAAAHGQFAILPADPCYSADRSGPATRYESKGRKADRQIEFISWRSSRK